MHSEPDVLSTAVCKLFLELPDPVPEPMEGNQRIRDAHWYAGLLLSDWQEFQRARLGTEFVPLPWYRQKAVCGRATVLTRDHARGVFPARTDVFSLDDRGEVWNILEACVEEEARKEYDEYTRVLRERWMS